MEIWLLGYSSRKSIDLFGDDCLEVLVMEGVNLATQTAPSLAVQPRAVLRCDGSNLIIVIRLGPDQVIRVIRVTVDILCTQLFGKVVQLLVFPAGSINQCFTLHLTVMCA
jgi:hypothetical protein